jgi:hypothetical protein
MHYITFVPLSLAILWVTFKVFAIGFLLILALIGWAIYVIFFKKDEPEVEERDPEAEFWDDMMEKQREDDAEFYKTIGRIEEKQKELEELLKNKK